MYSARGRLPASMTDNDRRVFVDEIITMLGLDELRDSLIGDEMKRGISGGQRKRVNVGIELVADPSVLFLDEPTSGLDSSSSMEICSCLRKLSRTGMTVVAVIHSPRYEIFNVRIIWSRWILPLSDLFFFYARCLMMYYYLVKEVARFI